MIQLLTGQPEWWIRGRGSLPGCAAARGRPVSSPGDVLEPGANLGHQAITGKDGNEIPLRLVTPAQPRETAPPGVIGLGPDGPHPIRL